MPTLLVDNFDSFTHNLDQAIRSLGIETIVIRSDDPNLESLSLRSDIRSLVISPGPKHPRDAIRSVELLKRDIGRVPTLGVCLGFQCLAYAFGGRVERLADPIHGRASSIHHSGSGLFRGIPNPMQVARYHSLQVDSASLPLRFSIDARTEDGIPMALSDVAHCAYGVQFHPESFLTPFGLALLANFFEISAQWHPVTTSPIAS